MQRPVRARPLGAYIVALALAMTLPPFLLAVAIATRWVSAEQAKVRADTLTTTNMAQAFVDRYLAGKIAMLQALATSPSLDAADFDALDMQARELLDRQGLNIVLRDLTGQQLVNTRLPKGAILPRVPVLDNDKLVEKTRQPFVTGLYQGVVAKAPILRVIVPVLRHGEVAFTLTASLAPPVLAALLRQSGVVEPYTGTIADAEGRMVARADANENLIGTLLPGFPRADSRSGTWSGRNPLGREVFGAYRRSTVSGWVFAIGIDRAILDAPLYRSLWGLAALAVVLGLLGAAASILLARKMIVSLRLVAEAAEIMGEGRIVQPVHTSVSEANLIGAELSVASARLHDQAHALASANRDLEERVEARTRELSSQSAMIRATLDNMDQGLMMIEADGTVPICNRRAMELLDLPEELLASRPLFQDILRYQLERDDFSRSGDLLRLWVAGGGLERSQHSYERERPNGTVLEVRTVPLADGSAVRTYTDITDRKRSERLAEHMARHDPLTGLPNRRLFRERLAARIDETAAGGAPFAVFYLDLDRFKVVNDTLGHAMGDALLCAVAGRICATASGDDTVARIGGDEFAIIQLDPDQPLAAERLAGALNAAVAVPVPLNHRQVAVGVSIGIALGEGDVGADALFAYADEALYRAKREGRNTFQLYDPGWGTEPGERRALELDLQQALARRELELRYQPILSASDRAIVGFEALLRWRHPSRGMVPPVEFIALAEETRAIIPIGAWVLKEACRTAVAWPGSISIAVNISAIQIEHDHLFATVKAALSESGLAPHRLELEITESVLAHENETVLNTLRLVRGLGVRIALDDFGTGYSSLSYLRSFPLDRIKIDRSFVAAGGERTTGAIMRTIVRLGTELGMAITAEGIETEEQLDMIVQQGCTEMQGYLFSPPVPLAEAGALVERGAIRRVA